MANNQQYTAYKLKGLYTSANQFSEVPEGSFSRADNCVLRSPGLLESRRGVDPAASRASVADAIALANFKDEILVFTDSGHVYYHDHVDGTLNPFINADGNEGSFGVPAGGIRTARANESLYWTTTQGIQKVEALASYDEAQGPTRPAGAPDPLLLYSTSNTVGATGAWLPKTSSVAYRATMARFDNNGYLLQSTPTARVVVANTSSTTASLPSLTVLLPAVVDAGSGWLVQLWRSSPADQTLPTDPSDELFQVWEVTVTAAHVAAGQVVISDTNGGLSFNYPLYTNANTGVGGGLDAANDRPPMSVDLCAYRDFMLYGNTQQRPGVSLTLLGVGTGGLQIGDLVRLQSRRSSGSTTTTFPGVVGGPQIISGSFTVSTASSSASVNIETTARDLCRAITQYFQPANAGLFDAANVPRPDYTQAFRCEYVGVPGENPGEIYIEAVDYSAMNFFQVQVVTSSGTLPPGAVWSPGGIDSGIGYYFYTSDSNANAAAVMWSNPGEPEAVPIVNQAIVGDPTKPVSRIATLGQTAFIFKGDNDGLWALSGSDASTFDFRQFDATISLVSTGCVASLDGSLYCMTVKGVEVFSESGRVPSPASDAIDRELLAFRAQCPNFDTLAFMTSYESEGYLILGVPSTPTSTACDLQYVYSVEAQGWTRWKIPRVSCAIVADFDNKLYFGARNPTYIQLLRERKALDSTDYQDNGVAIPCTFKLNPVSPAGPTITHTFRDVYWSWRTMEPAAATSTVNTDRLSSLTSKALTVPAANRYGWGNFPWGSVPWGAQTKYITSQHGIPPATSTGVMLGASVTLGEAGCAWQLQGVGVLWEPSTTASRS